MRVKFSLVFKVTSRYIICHTNIKTSIVGVCNNMHRVLTHLMMILDLSLSLKMTKVRHSDPAVAGEESHAYRSFARAQDD